MTVRAPELPAPGFEPAAVGLPWWQRAWRQGAGYILPNTLFLAIPAYYAWGNLPPARFGMLVVVLVATGLAVTGATLAVEWSEAKRWAWVGLVISLICGIALVGGEPSSLAYFNAYIASTVALLLPWTAARTVLVCTTLVGVGTAIVERDLMPGVLALMGLVIGYNVGREFQNKLVEEQLAEAEERTAVMAVAAERERIGRDLHDILGHSLTTIAVKADLASRLAGRDAAAAKVEIDDVARVARQALADVRATASGMREVRLATEVAAARSVLKAAGIRVESPSAVPMLSDDESELLGYVVREAVTNVLRHSGAKTCRIELTEDAAVVSDDGTGIPAGARRSGLLGLEERLDEHGWDLRVQGRDGTEVRAVRRVP